MQPADGNARDGGAGTGGGLAQTHGWVLMPWSPAHPGTSALSSGVTRWTERPAGGREGRSGGWPAGPPRAQTSGGTLPRNQAVSRPRTPPPKAAGSASNKARGRLPPAGASASVSMATPLPGQGGDSESPTDTLWRRAQAIGCRGETEAGEGPHPAPRPPGSALMTPQGLRAWTPDGDHTAEYVKQHE